MKTRTLFLTLFTSILSLVVIAGIAYGDDDELAFTANLSGAQEVVFDSNGVLIPGGVDTEAKGRIKVFFDKALSEVGIKLLIRNLTGDFAAAHFHCGRAGQNGPIVFGLVNPGPLEFNGKRIKGFLGNGDFNGADCIPVVGRPVNNIAALAFAMRDGLIYINVHSADFSGGEVRGQMISQNQD